MSDISTQLKWQDPPKNAYEPNSKHSLEKVARALRGNPGRWAVVSTHQTYGGAKQKAGAIRAARHPAWEPAGSFEAAVDSYFSVYARYVGDRDE